MCSNIPAKLTYGVYVSQLIRIARICDNYSDFVTRHHLLTSRLIKQGFWYTKLCRAFKKFARHHFLIFRKFGVSVKNHIQQGICLPIMNSDLSRNVIIRGHRLNHN